LLRNGVSEDEILAVMKKAETLHKERLDTVQQLRQTRDVFGRLVCGSPKTELFLVDIIHEHA
jgi:hypothetical protein